jgi:hypothetical protein
MMDVQATGQIMLGRRGLLAWGGRLAGAGAVGAFLPGMAWAQAAEKYPTIKAEFDRQRLAGRLVCQTSLPLVRKDWARKRLSISTHYGASIR